jgi:acetyltransferase
MSVRNLEYLLNPRSVAVIGASNRPNGVGTIVMRNLLDGGFAGAIYPVNPKYDRVQGIPAFARPDQLPAAPDLAVVCTPPVTVPDVIARLAERGTRAVVVITAGMDAPAREGQPSPKQAMLDAARPHLLRILGPNCIGLLVPGIGLNASFAHTNALPGNIAFISQSGALVTAVLDWAKARRIGFSHFISAGERADVDIADLIDYLGSDGATRAILLYLESIRHARKFLSAARAAARNKPIIVVKAGRAPEGARAAASHTGALAGSDDVFDAAIRRAGMLRVDTLLDLFDAVETLSHDTRPQGERLAVLTNGGGAGVLAADALSLAGGVLAQLGSDTLARLDGTLPGTWSRSNPIDIIGDAPVERYVDALKALADDSNVDAILFIHAPTAIVAAEAIARACVPFMRGAGKPLLTCWLGEAAVRGARTRCHDAGIADFSTPEEAVRAFMQLVTYRRNQALLLQTPTAQSASVDPDRRSASGVVAQVLREGREILTEPEAKAILRAYGIAVVDTRIAKSVDAAAGLAAELGFPVALKILSPDITHKSDVGGVALDLENADEVRAVAASMLARIASLRPDATVTGFTIQQMVRRPGAHELIAGVAVDPLFGPVILFGHGGTAVEVIADRAVALPPLNTVLARELVSRTRVAKLLAGYRDRPRADLDAIYDVLGKLSRLLIDMPQVVELDINPLLADDKGVIALDARVRVQPPKESGRERLAIRPYPRELEERIEWRGRSLLLRPIRPEDTERHLDFLRKLSPEDIRMRVFHTRRYIAPSELARLTQIDYEREMAFVAVAGDDAGETLGVVRAVTDPENARAEFGIVVRSDLKGQGLGSMLFAKIIRYCRERGTQRLVGDVLLENNGMLAMARRNGFTIDRSPEPSAVRVTLALQAATDSLEGDSPHHPGAGHDELADG